MQQDYYQGGDQGAVRVSKWEVEWCNCHLQECYSANQIYTTLGIKTTEICLQKYEHKEWIKQTGYERENSG